MTVCRTQQGKFDQPSRTETVPLAVVIGGGVVVTTGRALSTVYLHPTSQTQPNQPTLSHNMQEVLLGSDPAGSPNHCLTAAPLLSESGSKPASDSD